VGCNALLLQDGTVPYEAAWDTTEFEETVHTIKAVAEDTGGGQSAFEIQLVVDRTPPMLAFVDSFDASKKVILPVDISFEATDLNGIDKVVVSTSLIGTVELTEPPWMVTIPDNEQGFGGVTLTATAYDKAGN
jgi:hypothetical protein